MLNLEDEIAAIAARGHAAFAARIKTALSLLDLTDPGSYEKIASGVGPDIDINQGYEKFTVSYAVAEERIQQMIRERSSPGDSVEIEYVIAYHPEFGLSAKHTWKLWRKEAERRANGVLKETIDATVN